MLRGAVLKLPRVVVHHNNNNGAPAPTSPGTTTVSWWDVRVSTLLSTLAALACTALALIADGRHHRAVLRCFRHGSALTEDTDCELATHPRGIDRLWDKRAWSSFEMRRVVLELETTDPLWRSRRVSRDLNVTDLAGPGSLDRHVAALFEELRATTTTTATTLSARAAGMAAARLPEEAGGSSSSATKATATDVSGGAAAQALSTDSAEQRSPSPILRRARPRQHHSVPRPRSLSASVVVVDEVGRRHVVHRFENPEHAARALETLSAFLDDRRNEVVKNGNAPATVTLRYDESTLDNVLVAISLAALVYLACVEASFEHVEIARIVRVTRRSALGIRVFEFHCLSDHVDAVHVLELDAGGSSGRSSTPPHHARDHHGPRKFGLALLLDPVVGDASAAEGGSSAATSRGALAAAPFEEYDDDAPHAGPTRSPQLTEDDEDDDDISETTTPDFETSALEDDRAPIAGDDPRGTSSVLPLDQLRRGSLSRPPRRTTPRRRGQQPRTHRGWIVRCLRRSGGCLVWAIRRTRRARRPGAEGFPRLELSFGDAFGDSAGLKRVAEAANGALRDLVGGGSKDDCGGGLDLGAHRKQPASTGLDHVGLGALVATPLCVVCRVAPRDTLLDPCQHLHVCRRCAVHLRDCPICRRRIRDRRRVYM